MNETLGNKIAQLRRQKRLTQEEVAEQMEVSSQAVSKWENDLSCPDIMALPKLAGLLGVTVDALLSEEKLPEAQFLPVEARKSIDDMMLYICADIDDMKVRVNFPIPLVRVVLESGATLEQFTDETVAKNVDLTKVMAMIEAGVVGKLVEVDSNGLHVEIVVE